MLSPCLSVLLVSGALFIHIVKFVNRQVRQSVWCSGSVIYFSFFFFFLYTDGVYKIIKYLIHSKYYAASLGKLRFAPAN